MIATLPEAINFLGRILLVSYFLKAAINNSSKPAPVIGILKAKNFPFPYLVYAAVLVIQILGGLSVIFNFYPIVGALSLIGFTVLSNLFFCNYWKMEGSQAMLTTHLFFANIAIIGGLIIVLAT